MEISAHLHILFSGQLTSLFGSPLIRNLDDSALLRVAFKGTAIQAWSGKTRMNKNME